MPTGSWKARSREMVEPGAAESLRANRHVRRHRALSRVLAVPAEPRRRRRDPAARALFRSRIATVWPPVGRAVRRVGFEQKVCDQQVEPTVLSTIRDSDSHAGFRFAFAVERKSCNHCGVGQRCRIRCIGGIEKVALPFLGAGVVVFTLTRSASEAEEPTFCNVLARAL